MKLEIILLAAPTSGRSFSAEYDVEVAQMDRATGGWKVARGDYGNGVTEIPRPQPKKVDDNMSISKMADSLLASDDLSALVMNPSDQFDKKPGWVALMHELLNFVAQKTGRQQHHDESPGDVLDMQEQAKGLRPKQG